ncbi:hypothetical protein EDB84DRAFT_1442774 [Lactarius hengduanensis]|nr:hypothetical protein EDB84DRAFT_1442774 [Lactarius hengduanensis]
MTKRMKVSQQNFDGTTEGKVLEIVVQPNWKEGTKVRFLCAGNEVANGSSPDLVFVGDDLIAKIEILLMDVLTNKSGARRQLEHLDGQKLQVTVPPCCCFSNDKAMVATAAQRWRIDNDETHDHNNGRWQQGDSNNEDNNHADDSDNDNIGNSMAAATMVTATTDNGQWRPSNNDRGDCGKVMTVR